MSRAVFFDSQVFPGMGKQGRVFCMEGSAFAEAQRQVVRGFVLEFFEQSWTKS